MLDVQLGAKLVKLVLPCRRALTFYTVVPGVGPKNTPIAAGASDTWSYEIGLAHRFTENWGAAVTVGYEKDLGDTVGELSGADGYISYGLAVSYETRRWEVTTGIRYFDLGDANSSFTTFTVQRRKTNTKILGHLLTRQPTCECYTHCFGAELRTRLFAHVHSPL